jgi:hypothetical protein
MILTPFVAQDLDVHKPFFLGVCMIARHEKAYVQEWVAFHHAVGVQRFYIYQNDDDSNLRTLLQSWIDAGIVTVIPFAGSGRQFESYEHCLNGPGRECTWIAVIDGDEFIVPKKHDNIPDFINALLRRDPTIGQIGINWVVFGDNHLDNYTPAFLIDRFRMCHAGPQDKHVKCLVRTEAFYYLYNPHFVILHDGFSYVNAHGVPMQGPFNPNTVTTDVIQINHYWTKSLQEMRAKFSREMADQPGITRQWEKKFGTPEWRATVNARKDSSIQRFRHKLLMILRQHDAYGSPALPRPDFPPSLTP